MQTGFILALWHLFVPRTSFPAPSSSAACAQSGAEGSPLLVIATNAFWHFLHLTQKGEQPGWGRECCFLCCLVAGKSMPIQSTLGLQWPVPPAFGFSFSSSLLPFLPLLNFSVQYILIIYFPLFQFLPEPPTFPPPPTSCSFFLSKNKQTKTRHTRTLSLFCAGQLLLSMGPCLSVWLISTVV